MFCTKCKKDISFGKFFQVPEVGNRGNQQYLKMGFYVVCEECSKGLPIKQFQDVEEGGIVENLGEDSLSSSQPLDNVDSRYNSESNPQEKVNL